MAGSDAGGRGRGWLGRVADGTDVGSKLVPVGFGEVGLNLFVPRLLQVVGGGVLQVGLNLQGDKPSGISHTPSAPGQGGHPQHCTLRTSPGTGGGDW